MIRTGVIGCGYWGPNLIRCFSESGGAAVEAVCDLNPNRLAAMQKRYPAVRTTASADDLIADPRIDAIAIATPVATHASLALKALAAGKHVLVEKPMTSSVESSERLIEEAARRNLVLMVDHTFVYTGAVRKIRELVAGGQLGELYYYDSVRVNLGLFQHDVDVIWDLAVHDISIMNYVLPLRPLAVSACGLSHVPGRAENIAYLTIFCENNLIAHINVNWLAPVKVRRTMIGGSSKMIVYDDLEPSEKVKVYDKGIAVSPDGEGIVQMMISYRAGDIWIPQLDITEALKREAAEFIDSVEQGRAPVTDGLAGLRTVRILEMATRSMREQGRLMKFEDSGVVA
ncbi:MAG TPA: Gfo/Idh/MocA family oxidoreductase [Bryobacteraceae bacterium]|nr:Gfo/Idh/MocA family oxidoreductase [Bryobacteraceae bacterium]